MKKQIATAVAALAAASMAQTLNTAIWFDGSNQQVNTGADCVYKYKECESTTMGYWYDYDDRKNDNGDSYAEYPYEPDKYGSTIQPEIENLGYAVIKYYLKEPTRQTVDYPYNFVGFGFNVKDGDKTPFDISGTGGLCVTYTADHPVTWEIAEKVSKDASCSVTLKAAAAPTTVDAAIAEFTQPDWAADQGFAISGCDAAFKEAQSVKFKMDGEANAISGTLRIFEVGPKGTCTGAGTIGAEPAAFACKSDGDGNKKGCGGSSNDAIGAIKAASAVKLGVQNRTLSIAGVKDGSFEIVSLQGQVVKSGKVASSISLSSLDAGVYMVRVSGNTVRMSQKILVK
jgi:hypothetical protein